jgi:hypothetical protein
MVKAVPRNINERVVNLLQQVSEEGLISVAQRDDLTPVDRCLLEMFASFGESKTAAALKASRLKGRASAPSRFKVEASGAADRVAPEPSASRQKRKSAAKPSKSAKPAKKASQKGATKKRGRK